MAVDACPTCGEPLENGECLWHGPPEDPSPLADPRPRRRRKSPGALYVQAAALTVLIFAVGGTLSLLVDEPRAGGEINEVSWVDPYAENSAEDPDELRRAVERIEAGGRVVVSSDPPGADVYSGIRKLGQTPVRLERPEKSERMDLRISKAGFNETRVTVSKESPLRVHVRLSRGAAVKER